MQNNAQNNPHHVTVREAAVALQAAGVIIPANLPKIAYARAVREAYAKLQRRNAQAAAPKPAPKPMVAQVKPRRVEEPTSPAEVFAPGTRFVASRTVNQLRDIVVSLGGRDPLAGSKSSLARLVVKLTADDIERRNREVANAAMAIHRRRQKWQAKAAKAAELGVELANEERRTGIYKFETELELKERINPLKWEDIILDGLRAALEAPKPSNPPQAWRVVTPQEIEEHDEFMDRVLDANRRARKARAKRDADFVKKSHRKARGQRREEIAPEAEPVIVSLIDNDPASNPGRW